MSPTRSKVLVCTALTSLALLPAQQSTASSFQLREGSAAALGMSLAGRASYARDVSFVLGNPAALRGVENFEATAGLFGIWAISDGTIQDPVPNSGNPEGDAGTLGFVPATAVGYRLNEKFVLGLTVDAPFGLGNSYDNDWAGATDGLDSELLTLAVTPMVSFQPIPQLAIAGGITVQYADARLSNEVPSGEEGDLEGDDIDFGFIVGAAWDPFPGTSIGIRYRSGIDHTLEGRFSDNYAVQASPTVVIPIPGSRGEADLPLPASINFGFTQAISDRWRVMTEFEYTDWSEYDQVTIRSEDPDLTLADVQNYDSSWMGALGFEYDWSSDLTLRSGVAFDFTPTNDEFRNTRVPDGDRYWLSAGFSYEINDNFGVDAAYTFIALPDESDVTLRTGTNAGRKATYDSMIHVFGINGRYRF